MSAVALAKEEGERVGVRVKYLLPSLNYFRPDNLWAHSPRLFKRLAQHLVPVIETEAELCHAGGPLDDLLQHSWLPGDGIQGR